MQTRWIVVIVVALIVVGVIMFVVGRMSAQRQVGQGPAQRPAGQVQAPAQQGAPAATLPSSVTVEPFPLPTHAPARHTPGAHAAATPKPAQPGGAQPGSAQAGEFAKYMPNSKLTPGDTLAVTEADVCTPDYASKVRNVPEAVKSAVYKEYGIMSHAPGTYEVDHLISLELGGSNSERNLWPESYTGPWNAHIKDKVEDRLHAMVCKGEISLQEAQREIATDWITAYRKYVGGQ